MSAAVVCAGLEGGVQTLVVLVFLAGFGDAPDDPAAMAALLRADWVHPNAEGLRRIVEALGPAVLDLIARAEG